MPPVGASGSTPRIDAATVRRLGELARLRVDESRILPLAAELSAIVGYVAQLATLDGLDPRSGPPLTRRTDVPAGASAGLIQASSGAAVPFVVVPPVVGETEG